LLKCNATDLWCFSCLCSFVAALQHFQVAKYSKELWKQWLLKVKSKGRLYASSHQLKSHRCYNNKCYQDTAT